MERDVFEIPAHKLEAFEEKIAKLEKRSIKMGLGPIPYVVMGWDRKVKNGREVTFYEILLTSEPLKIEGWNFLARLDHTPSGNIICKLPSANITAEEIGAYTNVSSACVHCNHKRYRKATYLVRHDNETEIKQVGSTCLHDFLGHDPKIIASRAEMLTTFINGTRRELDDEDYGFVPESEHDVAGETIDYLSRVASAIRQYGWISSKMAYDNDGLEPTYQTALRIGSRDVTDEDVKTALAARGWAQTVEPTNNYLANIKVLSHNEFYARRHIGLAASIVGSYVRNQNSSIKTDLGGSFEPLIELMSKGNKAKYPAIHLQTEDGKPVVLRIAGERSSNAGSINVTDGRPYGENTWYGRVSPNGQWTPNRRVNPSAQASVSSLLIAMASDPAGTAAKFGKLTGRCSFCNRGLNDVRSTEVGYGPHCAKTYGLPWG